MALNEVSFYNTNGDEINITNLVNQMINYYNMKKEVGETVLTDFNEGSEIRNLLEAFAVLEYARLEEEKSNTEIAFVQTSYGQWLDKIAENPFINLERNDGNEAEGLVTFTLNEVQDSDFIIPAGTIVTDSSNDIDFSTTGDCTIFAGETTGEVMIECITVGVDGNVPAGNIDTITDTDINVELVTVTNDEATINGLDYEDDDSFRARILNNIQSDGFGSVGWYRNLCENVNGVHDVKFNADTDYTRKVLINGDVKPTPDSVLLEVLSELTNVDNIVLGHSFTVDKPSYDEHTLTINLNVVTAIDENELVDTFNCLFDGGDSGSVTYEGLLIGETLTRGRIENTLLMFDNVSSVTSITENGNEITELAPTDNNTVLKLADISFNQTEV